MDDAAHPHRSALVGHQLTQTATKRCSEQGRSDSHRSQCISFIVKLALVRVHQTIQLSILLVIEQPRTNEL